MKLNNEAPRNRPAQPPNDTERNKGKNVFYDFFHEIYDWFVDKSR